MTHFELSDGFTARFPLWLVFWQPRYTEGTRQFSWRGVLWVDVGGASVLPIYTEELHAERAAIENGAGWVNLDDSPGWVPVRFDGPHLLVRTLAAIQVDVVTFDPAPYPHGLRTRRPVSVGELTAALCQLQ